MKILFLYPNHEGYFRCPVGLTLIMTIVANEGHEVKLFDTTFMASDKNVNNNFLEFFWTIYGVNSIARHAKTTYNCKLCLHMCLVLYLRLTHKQF